MSNGWTTITTGWVLVSVSLVFVLLRIYVRFTTPGHIHNLSDNIVILAWLSLSGMVACNSALFRLSLLEPGIIYDQNLVTKNENPEDNIRMLKTIYSAVFPYLLVIYLVKAAIIAWYYAITPKILPYCRMALHTISAVCIVGFLVGAGVNSFWCWPISLNWTLDGHNLCFASGQTPVFFITFSFHILTDLIIFIYPISLLRSIRFLYQGQRKCAIIFLFFLGFVGLASSLARITAIAISSTTTVIAIWTMVQCTVGVIIACCPTLRVLVRTTSDSTIPAGQTHSKDEPKSPSHRYNPSRDTYTSNHTVHSMMHNEIWDGTDSTAPEWIRLESRGMKGVESSSLLSDNSAAERPHDNFISSIRRSSVATVTGGVGVGRGYVYTPPKPQPGLYLQAGRGIIQNTPVLAQPLGTPHWMELPDPPFLCE